VIPWFNIQLPSVGPVGIHAFGVLVAIGILVGTNLTRKRGRELGLSDVDTTSMVTTVLVCGFVLAHLFDVVAYQSAEGNVSLWAIINPFGGLSSFGGFAGALLGLAWWAYRHKQPRMPYADALAFGLAPGWMFGRLGCFTAHDHPGRITDFFLAVRYPSGTRHDLGLYEALWAGGLTALFFLLARKRRPLGIYVVLIAVAYAPIRFGLDFLRATDTPGADPRYWGLTPAQYGAAAALLAGVATARWILRNKASSPPGRSNTAPRGARVGA
jgi:phosphatidylglycerol:prolipoprotein diacylglycerol transferase